MILCKRLTGAEVFVYGCMQTVSRYRRMDFMAECIIIGAGGALGAICRYLIGLAPLNPESGFPLKTFLINVIGSFVIGIVAALAVKYHLNPRLILFLKVGICGGFTTFSSFALETAQLTEKGHAGIAFLYVVLSIAAGVTAVILADKMIVQGRM
jgi:CrcB protein